jgi:RNA polymerase primary sigma factor
MLDVETRRMEKGDADDPVAVYIREISTIEPLTKEEEARLFQQLGQRKAGDETVARKLLENRLALVVAIAEKYSSSGLPILDLIQEGNIGLMKAVKSFAEKPAGDFTGYAASRIEEAIRNALGKAK